MNTSIAVHVTGPARDTPAKLGRYGSQRSVVFASLWHTN
jgi:hypothetical protein